MIENKDLTYVKAYRSTIQVFDATSVVNVAIGAGICPSCDNTHLIVLTNMGVALNITLSAKEAEQVANMLLNPELLTVTPG